MKAKITLTIDDEVMRRVKERAAREGTTMSELAEIALRRMLDEQQKPRTRVKLPTFNGGIPNVDISDKQALHALMDEHDLDVRR